MNRLPKMLALAVLGAGPAAALGAEGPAPEPPPAPLPLAWCLGRAAVANPDLAAASETAEAARHRIASAGALADPRFVYEASNVPRDELDFDSTPLSGQQLRLAQKLPFPGLLASREEAAEAASQAALLELGDRTSRVAAAVEGAWAGLGFAQRALSITDRNVELLRQLSRIAEARYGVGAGLQQDVLRAQVQLTALLQGRLGRRAELRRAEAHLAELLDLPPDLSLPETDDLGDSAPLPALAPLLEQVESQSPALQALAARVEEAELRRRGARLEGLPDFDLGIGYRIRERVVGDPVRGDDYLSAGLTVRLPLNRSRWRAHVAEREALLRRAKAQLRAARAGLRERVRATFADLERADAEVRLLGTGLVPQARRSLESSRSGYEVGRIDFLSLLDSQVRLLDAELRLVRAVADRRTAFSALEATLGRKLR